MKIKLFYPAFDPGAVDYRRDIDESLLFQGTFYTFDGPLLDGLVSERVALLDFDPQTGALQPALQVLPPRNGQTLPQLGIGDNRLDEQSLIKHPKSVASIQALCFGAVMRTIYLVEKSLGRDIEWAFDGRQLLVVPRAGYQPNAFYQRSSHSLQFFFVPNGGGPPKAATPGGNIDGIYTALSPDIVSHETAHALVDAIAPSLHDAASPESLALHEAIADMTAFIFSLRSPNFLTYVVDQHGDADSLDAAYLGEIAEEIGKLRGSSSASMAAGEAEGEVRHYLRNLSNNYALKASEGMREITSHEPHDLSLVLSGALFDFFEAVFDQEKRRIVDEGKNADQAMAIAINLAAYILTNVIYRALDYLPPGEISFADFGRAMLAADQIYMSGTEAEAVRNHLVTQLARRGICGRDQLHPQERAKFPDLSRENLERFADESNDWQIYDFVRRFGRLFCLPDNTAFKVHDSRLFNEKTVRVPKDTDLAATHEQAKAKLDVSRRRGGASATAAGEVMDDSHSDNDETKTIRELLIKVSWLERDTLSMDAQSTQNFDFRFGTTVSIDLDAKVVLTRLTTNADGFGEDYGMASQSRQRRLREALIADWYRRGLLVTISPFDDDVMQQPQMVAVNGSYELRNMAHMLHVVKDEDVTLADWMHGDQDGDEAHV